MFLGLVFLISRFRGFERSKYIIKLSTEIYAFYCMYLKIKA